MSTRAARPRLEVLESRELLSGNVILDWNAAALDAIRTAKTGPPPASRALAILHIAMYDAVDLIQPEAALYPVPGLPAAPPGASAETAAAAAADRVLDQLFPAQAAAFDARLQAYLAQLPNGSSPFVGRSVTFGAAVADAVVTWRSADGSANQVVYTPQTGPGQWQPTPPAFAPAAFPQWADLTPFALTSPSQFRPAGPPALTSAAYAAAFNEVKDFGSATSTTRTADQTQIALFWADGGGTETPPGHWNAIAAQVAAAHGDTLAQDARLFAVLNIALADAAVAAWDAKYAYTFWRPVTAIRAADTDGNAQTAADPGWTPLLVTPAFPSYVSGHSTFSAAAAVVLTDFFGADVGFTASSDALPETTRWFASFADAAREAGQSRIYGGIHYQFDNRDGLALGGALGDYVLHYFLLPNGQSAPGRGPLGAGPGDGSFDLLDRLLLRATDALLPGGPYARPAPHAPAPGSGAGDRVTEALFLRDLAQAFVEGTSGRGFPRHRPHQGSAAFHLLQADATAFAFVEGLQPSA